MVPNHLNDLKPILLHWSLSAPPESIETRGFQMFSGDTERDQ